MSKLVFNHALGLSSPIAFKCNPLAALGTAIAGIGTLGNIFGQASANAGNERIARENREWQSEENRKSEQWQEKMWNANNVYNTPSAMKHRMLEAGINPFISSGGIGVNSAQLASSPSKQSAPNQPNMVAPQFGNVASTLLQAAGTSANVNVANQDAISKALDNAFNLGKKFNDWDSAKDFLRQSLTFIQGNNFDPAKSPEMQFFNQQIAREQANTSYTNVLASIEDNEGRELKREQANVLRQQFDEIAANIGLMASQGKLNDKMIDELASRMVKNLAEAGLANADAKTVNALRQYLKAQVKAESEIQDFGSKQAGFNWAAGESTRNAILSGVGQGVEAVDYYVDKVVDKVGKIGKINIGLNRSRTRTQSGSVNTTHSFIHSMP